jgi:hypothetical protein
MILAKGDWVCGICQRFLSAFGLSEQDVQIICRRIQNREMLLYVPPVLASALHMSTLERNWRATYDRFAILLNFANFDMALDPNVLLPRANDLLLTIYQIYPTLDWDLCDAINLICAGNMGADAFVTFDRTSVERVINHSHLLRDLKIPVMSVNEFTQSKEVR